MESECVPPALRPAGPADRAAGQPARLVGSPGTPDEVARLLAYCAERGLAAVPRCGATKIDWGTPPARLDVLIDLSRLAWPAPEQVPENQVATFPAGTALRDAQASLGDSGYQLCLDPPSVHATVGGVVATDEAGPLRHRYGPPSRQVLGLRVALPDGRVVTLGRDIAPLFCGTGGALGVIVGATLPIRPRPARRRWVRRPVRSPLELRDLVGDLLRADLPVAAVEVDLPTSLDAGALCVLLEGDSELVAAAERPLVEALGGEGQPGPAAPTWWGRYPFGPTDIAMRLCAPPAELHGAIYALRDAAGRSLPIRGSAGAGCLHAALPASTPVERLGGILEATRHALLGRGGSLVVLRAPLPHRAELDLVGPVPGAEAGRLLKGAFDPAGTLARPWPGIG